MKASDNAAPLEVLRAPGWTHPWLIHGFSSRTGGVTRVYRSKGDLNLGFTASDTHENVLANRKHFVEVVAGDRAVLGLVTLRQIHSSLIFRVDERDIAESAVESGDGLMTDTPGVLLGIQTADCIPVLVADQKRRAVAAFHAGWRGTVARIVEQGVARMRLAFGSAPEDLIASIGPGIGQCCYEVGTEVQAQFASQFPYASDLFHTTPSLHLNLAEANRRQLLDAGLKGEFIHMTGECTGCQADRFFSHRMEQGFTGRLMSVIGIARA